MNQYEEEFVTPISEYFGNPKYIREKIVHCNRADMLLLVDGKIVGIEIKSPHDTPKRLEQQIKTLCGFCDYVYVCVEEYQLNKFLPHITDGVGVLLKNGGNVSLYRESGTHHPDSKIVLSFLLANERRELYNVCTGKTYPKGYVGEWKLLLENFPSFPEDIVKEKLRAGLARAIEKREILIKKGLTPMGKKFKLSSQQQTNTSCSTKLKIGSQRKIGVSLSPCKILFLLH